MTSELNEQQLNIAIAKWVGWTELRQCATPGETPFYKAFSPDKQWYELIPEYCKDLNAIASAEAKLSDDEHWKFRAALWDATDPGDYRLGMRHNRRYASATALQRATALAKALNLEVEL